MDNLKTVLIVLALAAFIGVGVSFSTSGPQTVDKPVGALTSPDLPYNYLCVGGVCTYTVKGTLAATSSSVCAIQNPRGATTTVTAASLQITANGMAQNQKLDISTSSTALGSSTPSLVWNKTVTGSAQASISWTPQATSTPQLIGINTLTGETNVVLGPTEYLTFKIATGTPGTFSSYWTGTCTGTFRDF